MFKPWRLLCADYGVHTTTWTLCAVFGFLGCQNCILLPSGNIVASCCLDGDYRVLFTTMSDYTAMLTTEGLDQPFTRWTSCFFFRYDDYRVMFTSLRLLTINGGDYSELFAMWRG